MLNLPVEAALAYIPPAQGLRQTAEGGALPWVGLHIVVPVLRTKLSIIMKKSQKKGLGKKLVNNLAGSCCRGHGACRLVYAHRCTHAHWHAQAYAMTTFVCMDAAFMLSLCMCVLLVPACSLCDTCVCARACFDSIMGLASAPHEVPHGDSTYSTPVGGTISLVPSWSPSVLCRCPSISKRKHFKSWKLCAHARTHTCRFNPLCTPGQSAIRGLCYSPFISQSACAWSMHKTLAVSIVPITAYITVGNLNYLLLFQAVQHTHGQHV